MGRNKIEIETKKSLYERKSTYNKRRKGLLNKAKELSILCDAPVMLLSFSPTNEKAHIFLGEQCNFVKMIERYAAVPAQERHERRVEVLERLKNSFEKQGNIIDVNHELMGGYRDQSEVETKKTHLSMVQDEIKKFEDVLGPLSYLDDIKSIDDINLLQEMEVALETGSYNNKLKDFLKQFNGTSCILQGVNNAAGSSCHPSIAQSNGDELQRDLNGKVLMQDSTVEKKFVIEEDLNTDPRHLELPIGSIEEQEMRSLKGKAAMEDTF